MTSPAPSQPDARRLPRRSDSGNTLIEVVIAVALMATVIVPILTGITVATQASSRARAAATVETAIVNAVDRINRAPVEACNYHQYARAAVITQGWSDSEVTTEHYYLDIATDTWVAGPPNAAACPNGTHRSGLIKRVVITVRDPRDLISRSIEVVKSDV